MRRTCTHYCQMKNGQIFTYHIFGIFFWLFNLYVYVCMCHLYLIPIELQSSDNAYLYYTYHTHCTRVYTENEMEKRAAPYSIYSMLQKKMMRKKESDIQHCHYLTTCFVLCAFPSCSYHNANCTSYTPV